MIWLNGCPFCRGDLTPHQSKLLFRVDCARCGRPLNASQVSLLLGYTSGVSNAPLDAPGYLSAEPILSRLKEAA